MTEMLSSEILSKQVDWFLVRGVVKSMKQAQLTSNPKKLSFLAEVITGPGSNHSGEFPSRFRSVRTEDKHSAPVPLAKITACSDHH